MQGHPAYTGFAWYRRRVHIEQAPGAARQTALLVAQVDDAYEIYWNGTRVGGNGKLPPRPVYYVAQPAQTFGLGEVHDGVLAFRVWKAPLNSFDPDTLGGLAETPVIGSPTAIASRKAELDYKWLRRNQYRLGLRALYAIVFLLSMLTWLRNRKEPIPFWMGAFAFAPAATCVLVELQLLIPNDIGLGLLQPVLGIGDVSLWMLLLYLLQLDGRRRLNRLTRVLVAIQITASSLDGLLTWVDNNGWGRSWSPILDAGLTTITTTLELFPLVLIAFALRKRLGWTRWPVALAGLLSGMMQAVRVAAIQGSQFTHWEFGNWLDNPLLTVNGNQLSPNILAETLLLIAVIFAVYRVEQESNTRRSELELEFRNARDLQQALIPDEAPEIAGYRLTSTYRPSSEVGGDFFQILPLPEGETLVILGDVSGKGLKAAMAVSLILGVVRTMTEREHNPAAILEGLNRRLCGRLQGAFVTCIALHLRANGAGSLACAGHLSPFLNSEEISLPGALPLGLGPGIQYDEIALQIAPGDHFSLYTDGVLEARNSSGEIFGFDRLQALFQLRPTAEEATQAAIDFGQEDDITVLTLTRLATF